MGRLRPDSRPGRRPEPRGHRPRARHQPRLDLAGPADRTPPRGRALDLGTGCGVQALHLAAHAERVVATDVNRRALWVARLTAALNGVAPRRGARGVVLRAGARRAVRPGHHQPAVRHLPRRPGERLVYRDSGLPGDRVVEDIVREAPDHLAPDGWGQVLANWVIRADRPGRSGWPTGSTRAVTRSSCSVRWSTPRPTWSSGSRTPAITAPPTTYAATTPGWPGSTSRGSRRRLRLGEPAPDRRRRPAPRAPGLAVRRRAAGRPRDRRLGEATRTRSRPSSRLVVPEGVRQETVGGPGAADPETIVLRQQRGLRRARRADTIEAALVGACDGDAERRGDPRRRRRAAERDPGELARRTSLSSPSWWPRAS